MKKLGLILIAVALCVSLITSCAPQNEIDEVVDMKFDVSRTITRGLSASIEDFKPEDLYWKYTAVKADGTNYTTGQQTSPVWFGGKILKGNIENTLTLSVGTWNFTVYGYKDVVVGEKTEKKLVYQGSNSFPITITKSEKIDISVGTLKTENVNGTLVLDTSLWKSRGIADVNVYYKIDDNEECLIGDLNVSTSISLKTGSHNISIKITRKNNNDDIIYVNDGILVNIYDYLTTTVSGEPIQVTVSATINPGSVPGSNVAVGTATIQNDSSATITSKTSILATKEENTTSIEFPSGALNNGIATATIITYDSSAVRDDNNKPSFFISNNPVLLGGLDLTVEQNNAKVTSFNNPVTVSTFIGKGMDPNVVSVIYDSGSGNGETVENAKYNSETGIVTFKTTHFSRYYILAEGVVAVSSNGCAYTSLKDAIGNSGKDDTVYLLSDIELESSDKTIKEDWFVFYCEALKGTLNGNGYTIKLGKYEQEDKCNALFYDMFDNSTLKNVTVELCGGPIVVNCYAAKFENVTTTGESIKTLTGENNNGAFAIYGYSSEKYPIEMKNCKMNTKLILGGTSGNYNAAFIGYGICYEGTGLKGYYIFDNCQMNGVLESGKASLFLGNTAQLPSGFTLEVNDFHFGDNSYIRWISQENEKDFNGLISVNNHKNGVLKLNGTIHNITADFDARDLVGRKDTNYKYGPQDSKLKMEKNSDNTFNVTCAESKLVTKYIVSISIYSKYKQDDQTLLQTVFETIEASAAKDGVIKTTLKDLKFVDEKWVNNNSNAVKGELAGYTIYSLDNASYYLIPTTKNCYLDKPSYGSFFNVVALDENDMPISSYSLSIKH